LAFVKKTKFPFATPYSCLDTRKVTARRPQKKVKKS